MRISTEIEVIKHQTEILELKNSLEGFNSRLEQAEKSINLKKVNLNY